MSAKSTDFSKRLSEVLKNDAERNDFYDSLQRLAEDPPVVLRRNRLRKPLVEEYAPWIKAPVSWSKDSFFAHTDRKKDFRNHPYVQSGALYWQEGAATEAVELLDPQPDDLVLDLCSAPGSKATQIVERLAFGRGWLFANDVHRGRAAKLADILSRHGALWSTVLSLKGDELVEKYAGAFDRVLLDAPCSGESLYAKRADDRADIKDREVRACAVLQQGLIDNALDLLRAGGRLVYSTCTYSRAENEDVVEALLAKRPGEVRLLKESRRWPHIDGVPGGYFAVLEKSGQAGKDSELPDLGDWRGIITSGGQLWDSTPDLFAALMSPETLASDRVPESMLRNRRKLAPLEHDTLELTDIETAKAYFSGQAIRDARIQSGKIYRLTFKACPIGGGKGVEGRINSFLPKGLRVIG